MKMKFLAAIPITMVLFFMSCNNGGEENKNTGAAGDTAKPKATATATTPAKRGYFLVMIHKVTDYAKWLPGYEAGDANRKAAGLDNFIIGRGLNADSNTVLIALKMTDPDKAKAFGDSPDLKSKMKAAGVIGTPTVIMQQNETVDTSTIETKLRVMVTHKVKDWDAWKKEFDSHKQIRMDAGLIDRVIAYAVGDNHMVKLAFAITDLAKAKAFMESKDLKDKMAAAGVEGPPTIFYYTIAKKY